MASVNLINMCPIFKNDKLTMNFFINYKQLIFKNTLNRMTTLY